VIVFTTIGDLLMIRTDLPSVLIGGHFFAFSHMAFCVYWWPDLRKVSVSAIAMMVPGLAVIVWALSPPITEKLFEFCCYWSYGIVLETAACAAIVRGYAHGWRNVSDWAAAIGYFMFCTSDALLLGGERKRRGGPRTTEFHIVLTYAMAEVLLYFSLVTDPRHRKPVVVSK
jgi:hypothetical protein